MNQESITGKWKEIKGEIRSRWAKVTDDDLERAKGNVESIAGLIEQQYGETKEVIKEKLQRMMGRFSNDANQAVDDAKGAAADTTESAKDALKDSKNTH